MKYGARYGDIEDLIESAKVACDVLNRIEREIIRHVPIDNCEWLESLHDTIEDVADCLRVNILKLEEREGGGLI